MSREYDKKMLWRGKGVEIPQQSDKIASLLRIVIRTPGFRKGVEIEGLCGPFFPARCS
jgi:hypothetical protein